MKLNRILMATAVMIPAIAQAQPQAQSQAPDLEFTIIKENPITSVKNQNSSGTCWCFSAISFLESEAIRLNNIKDKNLYPDFSEMFVVSHSYQERADKYVRLDGNLTFHEITAKNDSKLGLLYDDVVNVYSKDQLESFGNTAGWVDAQLKLFAGFFGFDDYFYKGTMIEKYFKKIDEATDFNSTYEKIFNLARKQGGFVAIDDLFHPVYTIYNDGWHSELYPEDMNTKRWVVPYDGTGKIERFCVKRQRGWEGGGKRFIFYGPCNWENVTYVECDVVCEYAGAKYWFDKITAMSDRYNKVYEPNTLCVDGEYDLLGDGSYMVNITTAGYQYYSEPESDGNGHRYGYDANGARVQFTSDEEDFGSGYVYPEYKMDWTKSAATFITPMKIVFGVNYVTWV